jgi:L-galactono-1,4-lactone dehydrogenase
MLASGRNAASRFGVARNVKQIPTLSSNIRPISTESGSSSSNQSLLPLVAAGMILFGVSSSTEWPRTNLDAATSTISLDSTLPVEENTDAEDDKTTKIINWSGTHSVNVSNEHYWEPETMEQVEAIIKECHSKGQAVRPLGSSLSPNGIALHSEGMMSMAYLDKVLEIDTKNKTVTVQAGITVSNVVEALRPHGLTLPNLASIAEQQMGGFIQVGAHGTGRLVAPVDHYVTKLKLVTPGMGTIELTKEDGELFELAKVGLGCLGVVVEVTMECIPAHRLIEHTFVLTRKEAKEQLDTLLKGHKHMRYMWIPYTDVVVVVTNDPEDQVPTSVPRKTFSARSPEEKSRPLTDFLAKISKDSSTPYTEENMKGMAFGELRGTCTRLKLVFPFSRVSDSVLLCFRCHVGC